jgi:hypothetical protein
LQVNPTRSQKTLGSGGSRCKFQAIGRVAQTTKTMGGDVWDATQRCRTLKRFAIRLEVRDAKKKLVDDNKDLRKQLKETGAEYVQAPETGQLYDWVCFCVCFVWGVGRPHSTLKCTILRHREVARACTYSPRRKPENDSGPGPLGRGVRPAPWFYILFLGGSSVQLRRHCLELTFRKLIRCVRPTRFKTLFLPSGLAM